MKPGGEAFDEDVELTSMAREALHPFTIPVTMKPARICTTGGRSRTSLCWLHRFPESLQGRGSRGSEEGRSLWKREASVEDEGLLPSSVQRIRKI